MNECEGCGARIRWVRMEGGRMWALNCDPDPDGSIVEGDNGLYCQAVFFRCSDRPRYRSHYETCPCVEVVERS